MAFGIEVSQIAGEEPSIAKDGGSSVGTIPISFHHDRAAQRHFTDWRTFLLRLGIDNLALDTLHRLAYRADLVVVRRIGENGSCGFGEPVGL